MLQFPSSFVGKYFFADICSGWIRLLDPSNNTANGFASDIFGPVDLHVGPDGALYYLTHGGPGVSHSGDTFAGDEYIDARAWKPAITS